MNQKQIKKEQYTLQLNEKQSAFVFQKRAESKQQEQQSMWYYVGLAGDMGFTIAVPMIIGGLAGNYIDGKWHTHPPATPILLAIGFFLSIAGLVRTIREIIAK